MTVLNRNSLAHIAPLDLLGLRFNATAIICALTLLFMSDAVPAHANNVLLSANQPAEDSGAAERHAGHQLLTQQGSVNGVQQSASRDDHSDTRSAIATATDRRGDRPASTSDRAVATATNATVGASNSSGPAQRVTIVYPEWFTDTLYDLADESALAAEQGKRLALFFSAEECLHCIAMARSTFEDSRVIEHMTEQYDVIALDVFSDVPLIDPQGQSTTPRDFAIALRAQFTPTMVLLDTEGQPVARRVGFQDADQLLAWIDAVAARDPSPDSAQATTAQDAKTQTEQSPEPSIRWSPPRGFDSPSTLIDKSDENDLSLNLPTLLFFEASAGRPADRHQESEAYRALLSQPEIEEKLAGWTRIAIPDASLAHLDSVSSPSSDDDATTQADSIADWVRIGTSWAQTLELEQRPALVWISEDGQEVLRIDSPWLIDYNGRPLSSIGPEQIDSLISRHEYVESGAFKTHPQYQRWRAERLRGALER
ncbi:MAG: thioredoxin family protein [Thioalkalivibrionaceae bacterium]